MRIKHESGLKEIGQKHKIFPDVSSFRLTLNVCTC